MSALFAVTVAKVAEQSAEVAVISIHPDSGPPRAEATFVLMLLYDVILNSGYSDFAKWTHIEDCPLAQVMDKENFFDEEWIRKNARSFVASVKKKGDVLTVAATHPAWISHLRKGMSFETASYALGPGEPAEALGPSAPSEGGLAHSRNPSDGFRVGTTRAEDHQKLGEVFIPLFGANRYVPEPVITDPAKMREAAAALIGQPAVAAPHRGPAEVGVVTEVADTWVQLYYESGTGGWGSGSKSFTDIKSFGRAWLKEKTLLTPIAMAAPAKKSPVKKAAAKTASKKKLAAKKPKKKKR